MFVMASRTPIRFRIMMGKFLAKLTAFPQKKTFLFQLLILIYADFELESNAVEFFFHNRSSSFRTKNSLFNEKFTFERKIHFCFNFFFTISGKFDPILSGVSGGQGPKIFWQAIWYKLQFRQNSQILPLPVKLPSQTHKSNVHTVTSNQVWIVITLLRRLQSKFNF